MALRIGELAAATRLTVRTLHYYEEIGLLVASARSEAGHRRYSTDDVERLYRIRLLRQLGLSLEEVGRALDDPGWSMRAAISHHLAELEERLTTLTRLRSRLQRLLASDMSVPDGPVTSDLLDVLKEMTMVDTTVQRRISILVYADLEAAADYLERVFGLGPRQLVRDDDGAVVHAEVQAGDGVIWLHRETDAFRLASPRSLGAATGTTAVFVDDVDAHYEHAVQQGATILYEPVDQPYGYREYSVRDLEGGLWSFMRPLD